LRHNLPFRLEKVNWIREGARHGRDRHVTSKKKRKAQGRNPWEML